MRESCHRFLPLSDCPNWRRERCACRTLAAKTVAALPGCGKPQKAHAISVAFRAEIYDVSLMTFVVLKRKTMKTPPGRALEVSAR
jgi:hypothetical protein